MSTDHASHAEPPAGAGVIFVVGIGDGSAELLTGEAVAALAQSQVIVGYRTYIDQVRKIFPEKDYRAGAMGKEIDRCREALELALSGFSVSVVSSGDAGVYGMAGPMLEMAGADARGKIGVYVVPGVTAAQKAAALLGAPLMNDYITISLSDLLTPREEVLRRVELAAASDLSVCIYNPTSKKRAPLFAEACALLLRFRDPATPVGWVHDAGGPDQKVLIVPLSALSEQASDMRTIVIVGNTSTCVVGGRMVTRRGYERKNRT